MARRFDLPYNTEIEHIERLEKRRYTIEELSYRPEAPAQASNLTKLTQLYSWVTPEILVALASANIEAGSAEADAITSAEGNRLLGSNE